MTLAANGGFGPQRPSATPGVRHSPYARALAVEHDEAALYMMLANGGVLESLGVHPSAGTGSGEVCQFFAKAGWCKFGDGCRLRHEGTDAPPATAELCQFFSKAGWCRHGDQCKHIHALATAATGQMGPPQQAMSSLHAPGKGLGKGPPSKGLPGKGAPGKDGPPSVHCEFFAKSGWCKWGDDCRYSHVALPETPWVGKPGPPQQRTLLSGSSGAGIVCKYFAAPGGCKNGDRCPYEHAGIPAEPELCRFFVKTGWCKWGEECKYIHAGGPEFPLLSVGRPQPLPGEVCQFFQKAGWCKWGDACRYEHTGGPPLDGLGAPPPRFAPASVNEICQFFAKAGWCKFADACKYIHSQDSALPSSGAQLQEESQPGLRALSGFSG